MRRTAALAAVLGLLAVLLLGACSSPVTIREVAVSGDGTVLNLTLASCDGDFSVDFSEDDEVVMILVRERGSFINSGGGDDCQDVVTIVLDQPLGDRIVIDEQTGQRLAPRIDLER